MKKIQRSTAILLAAFMCLSFAACKKKPSQAESSDILNSDSAVNTNNDNITNDNNSSDASSGGTAGNTSGSGSGGGSGSKAKVDFGGKTLTLIYEYQPSNEKGIDPSRDRELDRIAQLNKKYNVNIVMKKGAANYNEAIVSSISAGTPIGNIIKINGNKNYDFIKSGLCAPLDDAMKTTGINMTASHYDQRTNKYYNINGKQYVAALIVPQDNEVMDLWFYNKDILAELGYKSDYIYELYKSGNWDWNNATKLFAAAKKVSANGTVTRYGLGCVYAYRTLTSMVLSNGGKIGGVDKTGAPTVNLGEAKVREALQQMYDWGGVNKYISPTEADETYSKFSKGEIFMCSAQAGRAKSFYTSGINFGVMYPPKGANGKNIAQVRVGSSFIIPVTYKSEAYKYLTVLDELYSPYPDASREDILKNDAINYFSDMNSWTVFRDSAIKSDVQANDDFTVFNLEWSNPAFGTVCLNLSKGAITPVVEKYNDQYQALLDDLFKGYSLTKAK